MQKANLDRLLELLDVRLEAFAMCEIENNCSLRCDAIDRIVVHYVLKGHGSIECEHGTSEITPGTMIVVPKMLAKRINGAGPVLRIIDANETCPFTEGMVKYRAGENSGDLVLACGSVSASIGEGIGLFDHLEQPLLEHARDETLPLLFSAILGELSRPQIGTKTIVEALMKQILVLLLRCHAKRSGAASPLYLPLVNPRLARALAAMTAKPQDPHSLESLAALAGMSRSRFSYHFAKTYGCSPIQYLQSVRLKAAARLLRGSTMPVKVIAGAAGFASRSHFSRSFREEFGIDPSAFRQQSGQAASGDGEAQTAYLT